MTKAFGKTCPRCGQAAVVKEVREKEGAIVLSCGCKFGKAALALAGIAQPGLKTAVAPGTETVESATGTVIRRPETAAEASAVLGKPPAK